MRHVIFHLRAGQKSDPSFFIRISDMLIDGSLAVLPEFPDSGFMTDAAQSYPFVDSPGLRPSRI